MWPYVIGAGILLAIEAVTVVLLVIVLTVRSADNGHSEPWERGE